MRLFLSWLGALLWLSTVAMGQAPRRVWIDTDIIFDKFSRDVDDGVALMMALQADQWQIEGISLVIDVAHGERVASKLLGFYRPGGDIPLYRGADQAEALGSNNDAVEAMAEALRQGSLTLIALGPATNVATLLLRYPHLEDSIEQLVMCVGRRNPTQHFQVGQSQRYLPDYNLEVDPLAMQTVLESKVPLTLAGFEAASDLYLSREQLKPLSEGLQPGDRWVWRQLRDWLFAWKVYLKSKKGFIPFDAATIGCVLAPEYFERQSGVRVRLQIAPNDCRMVVKTKRKPYLVWSEDPQVGRVCDYVFETRTGFLPLLLSAILRRAPQTLD
jgi:pyrimidine-specific ribonucleoside hydrolase